MPEKTAFYIYFLYIWEKIKKLVVSLQKMM